MKKWLLIILLTLITIQLVYAENCENRLENESSCMMLTPDLICDVYTYDIINADNRTIIVENETIIV